VKPILKEIFHQKKDHQSELSEDIDQDQREMIDTPGLGHHEIERIGTDQAVKPITIGIDRDQDQGLLTTAEEVDHHIEMREDVTIKIEETEESVEAEEIGLQEIGEITEASIDVTLEAPVTIIIEAQDAKEDLEIDLIEIEAMIDLREEPKIIDQERVHKKSILISKSKRKTSWEMMFSGMVSNGSPNLRLSMRWNKMP